MEYQEELQSCIDWYKENMPERIRALISLASYDLWHGPCFWDPETLEETDNESGVPFGFETACNEIRQWAENNVAPVRIEAWYCSETDHSEQEEVDGSERDILRALCGKALAEYI
jgi:hypothetical protein